MIKTFYVSDLTLELLRVHPGDRPFAKAAFILGYTEIYVRRMVQDRSQRARITRDMVLDDAIMLGYDLSEYELE